jgi:IS605 OrfB family transposase
VPAASVAWAGNAVLGYGLHGREMRGVRAKYHRIRKLIGRKKARHGVHVIDRVGGREHRTTRQVDFEAARDVVEKARGLRGLGYTVAVAVGDVRGHRKERKKGEPRCRSNRKLHSMSSHRLKRCIEDKAMEAGFPVSLLVHRGTRGSARTPAWGFAPDPVVQDGPAHSSAPTACDGGTFKRPRWDAPIFR